jgi:hypothetical protein
MSASPSLDLWPWNRPAAANGRFAYFGGTYGSGVPALIGGYLSGFPLRCLPGSKLPKKISAPTDIALVFYHGFQSSMAQ